MSYPLPAAPRFTLQPRAILDTRIMRRGNATVKQLLVHWSDLPVSEATWEYADEFTFVFLIFIFEDKNVLRKGVLLHM